jgi:exosortase
MEVSTGATTAPSYSPLQAGAPPGPVAPPDSGMGVADRPRLASLPALVTALGFVLLFAKPATLLVKDWWTLPEAGHGLLLAPVALWLAWRSGIRKDASPNRWLGLSLIVFAVLVRCTAELAAELFTMRGSMIVALAGIVVYYFGVRQALHWWLPFVLLGLSVPLPELLTQALSLPLQFKASQMGAALLQMRNEPVLLAGNVIRLPGQELFVTEACSGLRSLTALLSMAVLVSAMVLRSPISRVLLICVAVPIAIIINGVRVFLTGFLVFFVNPELGKGFMHLTEGWLLFLVSLACLAAFAWAIRVVERPILRLRGAS